MTLKRLIQQSSDWQARTAEDIFAELSLETEQFVDSQLWSLLGLAQIIGPMRVQSFIDFLDTMGLSWVATQAAGKGVHIGDETINAMLLQMGTSDSIAIARAGRRLISKLELNQVQASLQDVSIALEALKLDQRKRDLIDASATRWNQFCAAVDSWDGTTPEPEL
jgi:hypothetical protein